MIGREKEFSTYVCPKLPISASAEKVTGIILHNSGTMTVHGQEVHAEKLTVAIKEFCRWLKQHSGVFLIAHNGRKFDFPILMSALINIRCEALFFESILGLIDSISVLKKAFPAQSSYKQDELAKVFLGTSYDAHNAMEDVRILGKLISHTKMDTHEIAAHSFPPSAVFNQLRFNREKAKNINSLHPLIAKGIIKMPTAENVAGSGLCLNHLFKIYQLEGEDGVRNTFICKNSEGQPRVTSMKKTLDDAIPKLGQFFSSDSFLKPSGL